MSDDLLHHMPGSCSRVALVALEQLGRPYRDRGVDLMGGEQHGAAFRAINAKGKVPVLVSDGVVITELPVILHHLAARNPEAGLLPEVAGAPLQSLSDLIWMSGALHPLATRIFRPGALSQADAAGVKAGAVAQLAGHAEAIGPRLAGEGWWFGGAWSLADALVAWIFGLAAASGFPLGHFPAVAEHRIRSEAQPAFGRAVAREHAAVARDGLSLPPGLPL